ncbi:MAG: asparagine synthase (glutamine-hydrolyzing) [Bacteroidota bacterium]
MCGIAGILHFNGKTADASLVQKMTNAMAHRGPDADCFYTEGAIGLGHRRLSIIDLSAAANQPFTDNSGRYTMVFNGEMYNFMEVKSMLHDYDFHTSGDTEVLIAAFAKWGAECIHYFKGMYALAVWDKINQELTVIRDRLGVKPLYYYIDNDKFIFASEVRAILATGFVKRKINKRALLEYFSYQSIGYPFSPVEGIEQLQSGSWMTIKNGKIEKKIYWDVTRPNPLSFNFTDRAATQTRIRKLLRDSIERRLVSDVPVGAFLSGGIDSSAVVGLMAEVSSAPPNTFNISFGESEFDESKYAEIIAKKFNTNHTKIQLQPGVFLAELENGLNAMDTPSGDGINTYVVSKAIRQAGITVALSGAGGDELFAGYPFFLQYLKLQQKKSFYKGTGLLRKMAGAVVAGGSSNKKQRLQQIITAESPAIENLYPVFRQILSPALIHDLTSLQADASTALMQQLEEKKEDIARLPLLSQVSVSEYMGYTQQTLLKDTDQMSMAVSLEVREPFFDFDLIEFVLQVPDAIKYPAYAKRLLVESLKPLLPDEIVHRKKQGFLFPWNVWMKNELKSFCETRLIHLSERSFIHGEKLMYYWNQFLKGSPAVRWAELWLFVVLEYWMEKNNIDE